MDFVSFLSPEFTVGFLLFFLLYWSCRSSVAQQNGLLLVASYLIVASFSAGSAAVMLAYGVSIHVLARFARRSQSRMPGCWSLALLVCAFFFVFKYYPFLREDLQSALGRMGLRESLPVLEMVVPLGLSFYAFHSVSYVVSVARREVEPLAFSDLLLYLSFFPSVVAGPINRAKDFIPQIRPARPRELRDEAWAIGLIALAIAKLFLCSAMLAENYVNGVFDMPDIHTPAQTLTAVYAYAWQIYFNFSGYTDLVTGLALLLGFRVPRNFDAPYLARNPQEFWQRWHISLSSFIRDYVYIPLGGNRHGFMRRNANVLIAMTLSGVWHGAGLNFMLWGALHGVGLILFKCKNRLWPTRSGGFVTGFLARLLTFHYVAFAWIFFRADGLDTALSILRNLAALSRASFLGDDANMIWLSLLFFAVYPLFVRLREKLADAIGVLPWFLYPVPLVAFLTLIFAFSPPGIPGFIYANF